MRFSYASPARLADIPCLDAASLRAAILTQVAHGWRVLAFFGLPRALYAQGAGGGQYGRRRPVLRHGP